MGLDSNAAGEWEVRRSRVLAGQADTMRALRIKSERKSERRSMVRMEARRQATSEARETREPSTEGYYDIMDVVEDALYVDDEVVDMTDSTAVF